jgi:tRNA A-37 threonylcarbamoyl transferase component Bud32
VSSRQRRPSGEPPPLPRELDKVAIFWMFGFVLWAVVWAWVFLADGPAIWITERDLELMDPIVDNRQSWLTPTMQRINEFGTFVLTPLAGWTVIAGGLANKRIRHILLMLASLSIVALIATTITTHISRSRPLGISQIGYWEGFAQPSRPVALATVALVSCVLTMAPRGLWRRVGWVVTTVVLVVFGFAQLYTGVDHPTDVMAGATVGVAVTLFMYRMWAPERVFPISYGGGKTAHLDVTGARGDAIRRGLERQLSLNVVDITPVGLAGSAGSTPLRVTTGDGSTYFAKLYAQSHLRSDRSYKLGRTLMYGRLEDEQHFTSVRRLIQHEHYMLHVMRDLGVDTMKPIGIVEITPDREYLLVTEFLDGATEISEAEVTQDLIDQGLAEVATMWQGGIAHRDIKPANLMVQDGRLRLIDVAFAQIRPTPWRQAVDLANMMLVLALGSTPELVYERARLLFSDDEISEAFAAARGVTLPSALRADVRRDGRELLEEFRSMVPARRPVAIQRWTIRRVGLIVWVTLVGSLLILTFLGNLEEIGLR